MPAPAIATLSGLASLMSSTLESEQAGGCAPQHLVAIIAETEPAVERRHGIYEGRPVRHLDERPIRTPHQIAWTRFSQENFDDRIEITISGDPRHAKGGRQLDGGQTVARKPQH